MKKFVLATLLVTGASVAQAGPKLVPADTSELSQLCVAAAESRSALQSAANEIGLNAQDLQDVRCNGVSLTRFAAEYRTVADVEEAAVKASDGYILKPSDDSPLAALCIAAASSQEEYERVKEQHFSQENNLEAEVMCNGVPLKNFARRFRDAQTLVVSQR